MVPHAGLMMNSWWTHDDHLMPCSFWKWEPLYPVSQYIQSVSWPSDWIHITSVSISHACVQGTLILLIIFKYIPLMLETEICQKEPFYTPSSACFIAQCRLDIKSHHDKKDENKHKKWLRSDYIHITFTIVCYNCIIVIVIFYYWILVLSSSYCKEQWQR